MVFTERETHSGIYTFLYTFVWLIVSCLLTPIIPPFVLLSPLTLPNYVNVYVTSIIVSCHVGKLPFTSFCPVFCSALTFVPAFNHLGPWPVLSVGSNSLCYVDLVSLYWQIFLRMTCLLIWNTHVLRHKNVTAYSWGSSECNTASLQNTVCFLQNQY